MRSSSAQATETLKQAVTKIAIEGVRRKTKQHQGFASRC